MGLLATLSKLLQRTAPALPPAARVQDISCLIDNSTGDVRPVLVTGCVGSGKTVFVREVSRRFSDCVVYLHRSEGAVTGFEEAPLMGRWLPSGQAQAHDADLEDVLRTRPEGLFSLEMPAQSETDVDLNDLLNTTLMSGVLHWEAAREHGSLRTLTLILEDGGSWLPDNVLTRLLERGRAWQLRVVLVEAQADLPALWANLGHLVAFKSMSSDYCMRLGHWLEEPAERLRHLAVGQGLYRSASWKQAQLGAQLFTVTPANV